MVICAAVGFLTAKLFRLRDQQSQLYGADKPAARPVRDFPDSQSAAPCRLWRVLSDRLHRRTNIKTFLQRALFGIGCLVGLSPTLIANAISAGSPFATTYGGQDVSPPDFTFSITCTYLRDLQGILMVPAIVWVVALLLRHRTRELRPIALITAINLAVNLGYFLSHHVFTQYYLMPLAMLSLWGMLFANVLDNRNRGGTVAVI
jgi:hypothetical protein